MTTKKTTTKKPAKRAATTTAKARKTVESPPPTALTSAKGSKAEATPGPDMTLALAKPLSAAEVKGLRKIGDTDRAISARAGKLLAQHESDLAITGVSSASILQNIRIAEAIEPNEALAQQQVGRLTGARMVADDRTWAQIVKLHRRLQNEGQDNPKALSDFQFLMDYMANRSLKVEEPNRAPRASDGAAPPAKGTGTPSN